MSKYEGHTPGPWKKDGLFVTGPHNEPVATVWNINRTREAHPESEANARAIAAVPDLLELSEDAVRYLVRAYGEPPANLWEVNEGHRTIERLRAALAKVEK